MHQQNIEEMYSTVKENTGFDVVIIVSSSNKQAKFWQQRLTATSTAIIGRQTRIVSVHEDWPGGAGQLLGTLYAWKKAQKVINLNEIMAGGGTVAMYHTAGKGTRMAPLPASEDNNKSAIKLPRMIDVSGIKLPLTVLEAVIFQTGIFASSRTGRLCVFWGDQVFIPSNPVDFARTHHGEILDIRSAIPSDEETWKHDWQSYGLIIPADGGDVLQREKQNWEEVQAIIQQEGANVDPFGNIVLGKSLGCFTLSTELLSALLDEFENELSTRQGKLDTDPHLWMPLTSEADEFVFRGGDPIYWDRINHLKERFLTHQGHSMRLFGDTDIGSETLWWDYGQVRLYHHNFLKALDDSFEGQCLRKFFDLESHWIREQTTDDCHVENSIMIDSRSSGTIRDCLFVNSRADNIDVSSCVLINSILSEVKAKESLIYNCTHLIDTDLGIGAIVSDMFTPPHGRIRMKTEMERDGKEDWEICLPGNPYSYADLARLVDESY